MMEPFAIMMLGTQIAVFCGGDYMDYYCCSPRDGYSFTADNLEFVKKRLQEIKVVLNPIQG